MTRTRRTHWSRNFRVIAAFATGGMLFQTAGCATTFAPLALSLLENLLLSQLVGGAGLL